MNKYQLDARHLLCPLPVIRTQNKIKELQLGDQLEVVCTDPGALSDIPSWCKVHGHQILATEELDSEIKITLLVGER